MKGRQSALVSHLSMLRSYCRASRNSTAFCRRVTHVERKAVMSDRKGACFMSSATIACHNCVCRKGKRMRRDLIIIINILLIIAGIVVASVLFGAGAMSRNSVSARPPRTSLNSLSLYCTSAIS